jgi:hypothetical protein
VKPKRGEYEGEIQRVLMTLLTDCTSDRLEMVG